jgi:hypothetical protein
MSSTATQSLSVSFTVADIGKVIDCFAADLDMNAQSTGLLGWEAVRQSADDVKLMAQKGYLVEANIVLEDPSGRLATRFSSSTKAIPSHRAGTPHRAIMKTK